MNWKRVSENGYTVDELETFLPSSTVENKKGRVYSRPFTFDIEVTNYKSEDVVVGVPYIWMVALSGEEGIYGRTLDQFVAFINELNSVIPAKTLLVIYVHNLSYEFQFLRRLFEWKDVFLINRRKILYGKVGRIEFRCSYMLSNMSLDKFLNNNHCKHQKLSYDYDQERYPWEPLTEEEIAYCGNDTVGLYEAVVNTMEAENDTIISIPYTSTGYVRRDIRECTTQREKRAFADMNRISPELYEALRAAFVGGNCHASRYYAGKEISDVTCYDIASSYPYAQLTGLYPINPFRRKTRGLTDIRLDKNFAYVLLVRFKNIYVKPWDGMPSISLSKCIQKTDIETDNGRILAAKSLEIWVTDIELSIINSHYDYDCMDVLDCYYSKYGYIPDSIKAQIYLYFKNKSLLKYTDEYLYRKSKEKLNSIYGMSAFDIGKARYVYQNGEYQKDSRDTAEILNSEGMPPEPYQWGVWTTAIARKNLNDLILEAGHEFIYCDTDSVYVNGEMNVRGINATNRKKAEKYIVRDKEREYVPGKWEIDKRCQKFKTLGSKKYIYEDEKGLHTVTAGLSKSAGKVRSISEYCIGKTFENATLTAYYTDDIINLDIKGHTIAIPSSIYLEPNCYTLGVTDDYYALLEALHDENFITEMNF